jgi:hypothetical protein
MSIARDGVLLVFTLMLAQGASGATLKGRALEDRSGSAVAAASLRIQQSGAAAVAAEVETDAEGRFEVEGLAEGDYRIEVSKRNFVSSVSHLRLPFGGEGFTLWLVRCGSISGRVADQGGESVSGATVFVFPKPAEGEPLIRASGAARSARVNEKGEYRVSSLPPGEYAVAVSWSGSDIVRSRMRIGATTAAKFGSGLLFYPGNAQIEFVDVSGGAERRSTDFVVLAAGLQELSGKVEISDPEARFDVALVLLSQPGVTISAAESGPEGRFRFSGVPLGSYEVIALGPNRRSAGEAPLFARTRVEVAGPGTESVTLTPRPGRSIAMQLRSAEEKLPQACPQAVALTLTPISDWGVQQTLRVNVSMGRETAVASIAPDQYRISAQNLAEGCYIAGSSVLDLREAPSGSPVTVTLAGGGSINGRVIAGKRNVSDVAVILVPSGIDSSNRVVSPGQDGRFSFSQLPPGSYRIGARLLGGETEPEAMFPIEVPSRGAVEVDLPVYGTTDVKEP